jgi:two-component system chemotaxis response regulator CheB
MANRDLIVVGTSAGGLEALQRLCGALPPDLNAAVLIVMHVSPYSNGLLPRVLSRSSRLPAVHPTDGDVIRKGSIYVAPPDLHMIVDAGRLRTVRGPRENHSRPAIDPTFRSAAVAYGPRVIGVILTGLLDDGTAGLMVVRSHGGDAIVQDPRTALFPGMPKSALERVPDAHVLPLEDIPQMLAKLVAEPLHLEAAATVPRDSLAEQESQIAELEMPELQNQKHPGKPSEFACPECGGVLWEIDQSGLLRFRCRVGHAYTAHHLRAEQRQAVETALWAALRALEESVALYQRMADRARNSNHDQPLKIFLERAETAENNAKTLRDFLVQVGKPEMEGDVDAETG